MSPSELPALAFSADPATLIRLAGWAILGAGAMLARPLLQAASHRDRRRRVIAGTVAAPTRNAGRSASGPGRRRRHPRFAMTRRLRRATPHALDLLALAIEAGLPTEQAIVRAGAALRPVSPELAAAFADLHAALVIGQPPRDCFAAFSERVGVAELASAATTLAEAAVHGGGVAVDLKRIAEEARRRQALDAEARMRRLPILLSLPLALFVLPSLLLVLLGPAALRIVDVFDRVGAGQ